MTTPASLAFLTPEQRDLQRGADVPALLPRDVDQSQMRASTHTTERAGFKRLVALDVKLSDGGASTTPSLEILTLVRAALMSSIPAAERSETNDGAFMRDYLQREAASGLALRTLELGDGAAYELTTPLHELISARQADLPAPDAVKLHVDGGRVAASRIAFGAHVATWADLPGAQVAVIVYGRQDTHAPELVGHRP